MKNQMKTVLLLGALTGLLVGIGNMVGGRGGATVMLFVAGFMNFAAYWWSDKIALKMSRAKPLAEAEAPQLFAMVRNLSQSAGLPMPSLHLIPSEQPNAFATGRNPAHGAIAVTEGIMKLLSQDELEGVLAHELAHIANRDILISSVAATIAGAISWVASIARWSALFGGGDDDDNPLGVFGVVIATTVAALAAVIIQLAISRSREFHADASGAGFSGRPESLANALRKIEHYAKRVPLPVNPSAAPLYIINPLRGGTRGGLFASMFSTHPPTEERVRRLETMSGTSV